MLRYAAIFFALTIIAFVFGFLANILAGGAIWIAKILFFVFLGLFVITMVADMIMKRKKGRK